MSQVPTQNPSQSRGLTVIMAERFQMEPARFVEAIKATVIKGNVSDGQLAAFLMVAHEYNLNPLTKEIYAFPSNGGIQPIVSIDGWMKMINSHPEFDGMEFQDHVGDDGNVYAITCRIYRKDRSRPTEATEYMAECKRGTEPWRQWPLRMLRHKAAIQCARYAFSFAGIIDEDEFARMKDITPQKSGAERLKEARAQAEQEGPADREGFDPEHVQSELQKATQEPQGWLEGDDPMPEQQAPAGEPPELDEGAKEMWDEAKAIDGTPAEQHLNERLADYKAELDLCDTPEEVDNLTPMFADDINAMSKEDKASAKQMRMDAKARIEGEGK